MGEQLAFGFQQSAARPPTAPSAATKTVTTVNRVNARALLMCPSKARHGSSSSPKAIGEFETRQTCRDSDRDGRRTHHRRRRTAGITDGSYLVGTEIALGTYKSSGGGSLCYADTQDKAGNILEQEVGAQGASVIIRILSGAYTFKSSGCGTWTKVG